MDDIENKVDRQDHENLQEEVWELQRELEKLRKEFYEFRNALTGDGK